MIRCSEEICHDLAAIRAREWLETNGIGGFASSTIAGWNTRRYHGLLTAALGSPDNRKLLLSKLEETLIVDGRRYELGTNQYPGVIYPTGYLLLSQFRLDPFPTFTWLVEDIELHKSVFVPHGENTVVVQYLLRAQGPAARHECSLELRPLIAFRDFHATTHANHALRGSVNFAPGVATVSPYPDLPALHFAHDAEAAILTGDWYRNFEYVEEQARGLDFQEDLYQPFLLTFDLSRRIQATAIASTEPHGATDAAELRQAKLGRRKLLRADRPLVKAADQFVVSQENRSFIMAGYHWFGRWGRDTLISLPGLALSTGRAGIARDILRAFADVASEGMLPNRFPDLGGEPEYNTVDAALWFFEAVRATEGGPGEFRKVLANIIDHHLRGTRFGIQVDRDGLLSAGDSDTQLTWMDARVNGIPVTPRAGKPVEIQALWYNALAMMGPDYSDLAGRAKSSFSALFWNESANCLYDVLTPSGPDASIRPNQVLAVALPHPICDNGDRARRILEVVSRQLLTPFGLRTLSPRDPRYRGHYGGAPAERDGAYHQGTVWPYLMGYFLDGWYRTHGSTPEVAAQCSLWIQPLLDYANGAGLGQIPEVFSGDPPHQPGGAIAQAWSVGEILRTLAQLQHISEKNNPDGSNERNE